jgi:hypothetical protein
LFQHVKELNRAFLGWLQIRARAQRGCLGLPAPLRPVLRAASPEWLDALADFPSALFRLRLDARPPARTVLPASAELDEAERGLGLSILLAARHTCRQSAYQARVVFALEPAEVERLASASLADVQLYAATPGLLQCALADRQWFWSGLFSATLPEARRQLTLMALQPRTPQRWPARRPPHAIA